MTTLEWVLTSTLVVIYIALWVTVAMVTLRKGHVLLFIVGIFIPILWLIGAVLPPKPGSAYPAT